MTEEDHKYLRFLWYENGDLASEPQKFCMTRHIFGATSSPSCASYCLKRTAHDNEDLYPESATRAVLQNFYVDDFLKSTPTVQAAIQLIPQVIAVLNTGSFKLTKFLSNSQEVMTTIDDDRKAPSMKQYEIDHKQPFSNRLLRPVNWL